VAILDTHRDLPVIAWTVVPAGSTLSGHVNGLAPAGQVRAVFGGWRAALGLDDAVGEHVTGAGTVHLHAMADRHRVRVRLTATIFDDESVER
jgi:hypothetical protein